GQRGGWGEINYFCLFGHKDGFLLADGKRDRRKSASKRYNQLDGGARRKFTVGLSSQRTLSENAVSNCLHPVLKRQAHPTKGAESPWLFSRPVFLSPVHRASLCSLTIYRRVSVA